MSLKKFLEIPSRPDAWVRHEKISMARKEVEITFGIYQGKRGRKVESWKVICSGIQEAIISDLDGGGLRLYKGHPAAQQYIAPKAQLRWNGGNTDASEVVGGLYQAHTHLIDDWIPFDRYGDVKTIAKNKVVWTGPVFLMKAYARALRALGIDPVLKVQPTKIKKRALKVLHFGNSFIVAESFKAQPLKPVK